MLQSPSLDKLLPALMKFRQEVVQPKKTEDNPYFKSKYADLSEIMRVSEGPLADNNMMLIQGTDIVNGADVLVTTLVHSSGQYIQSVYRLNPIKDDPQGLGGAVTYARRYSIQCILGLVAEDDDGNYASGNKPTKTKGKKDEPVDNGRTQADFVKVVKANLYPKEAVGVVAAHIGKALSGNGFSGFDASRWDEMYAAVEKYAGK